MNHSYEEIRQVVLNITANRDPRHRPNNYDNLRNAVATEFENREGAGRQSNVGYVTRSYGRPRLSAGDADLLLEVFWGLFREGILTLGLDDANREFPWFRVTGFGEKIAQNQEPYFFHDVSSYESIIKTEVPNMDAVTLIYLKEAMQAFKSGCLLSSSVMLGVATEHTFAKLLDTIESNPTYRTTYQNVRTEKSILRRLNKFKNILDQNQHSLTPTVKEDLDTNFVGITSVIRNFRNDSGHPSGKLIDREQCYVLLQLFVPYCKKMYQLIDLFKK